MVTVAQRYACACIRTDKAVFSDADGDVPTARQGAHGTGAAAKVCARAEGYALRDASLTIWVPRRRH